MKLSDTCEIAAPREIVWETTIDIERWPEWTPTVQIVERIDMGPLRVGSEAILKQPGRPRARLRVTLLEENRQFVWETHVRGLHIVATHKLADYVAGTRNTQQVELRGVSAWLLAPLIWFSARRSLKAENAGLKRYCEARAGSGKSVSAAEADAPTN